MPAATGPRLLDRADELARLDALLDELPAGGSPTLVVEGEPGIGKTRLLSELGDRARARGGVVVSGRAAEYETTLPFAAWVEALDDQADAATALGPADLAELARVLPSLADAGAGEAGLVDERHRLHNAMRKLLAALAGDGLLVVILDDLHWADPSSIDLIGALVRRPPPGQVLLALGYRPRQVAERLRAGVAAAERERRAEVMRPSPLGLDATARLAGDGLEAQTVELLFLESGGNPFYVEQLARSLHAGATPQARAADRLAPEVPPAVAAALEEELRALDSDVLLVLQGAAIAGAEFGPQLVSATAGVPPDAVQRGLDELLAAGLVRPAGSPGTFTVRHPLVRRAIYQSTGPAWRLSAHGRAVGVLRERGVRAEGLAHHVAASAQPGDDAAIDLLTEAADASRARAPATAADWFARALELLPPGPDGRRPQLHTKLADARIGSGRLEEGRSALLRALEQVEPSDVTRHVRLIVRCAAVEHLLGRHDDAHRRLQGALDDLSEAAVDERLALIVALAISAFYRLDIEDILRWGAAALEDGERHERPAPAAAGAGLLGMAEAFMGRTGAARAACDTGARLMAEATDLELAGCLAAAEYLGLAEMYIERFEDAVAHANRGIAIARVTGQGERIPVLAVSSGFAATMLGRIAEAKELLDSAVDASRLVDSPFSLAWVLMNASVASWLSGDLVRARRQAAEVIERLTTMDDNLLTTNARTTLAQIELDDGDHRRATQELLDAGGGPGIPNVGGFWRIFVLESLTRAEVAGGRSDAARAAAELAMRDAPALDLGLTFGVAQRAMALALLDARDAGGAAQLALESAAAADAVGARIEAARSRALAGRALAAADRRGEALEQLRTAAETFESCGARREGEAARDALQRLGEVRRFTARGDADVSGLDALTGREAEIAELVWDRRTNREIAETLFLSPKTIETHLRNIFVKVGVSSRVDLAREVERAKIRVDP